MRQCSAAPRTTSFGFLILGSISLGKQLDNKRYWRLLRSKRACSVAKSHDDLFESLVKSTAVFFLPADSFRLCMRLQSFGSRSHQYRFWSTYLVNSSSSVPSWAFLHQHTTYLYLYLYHLPSTSRSETSFFASHSHYASTPAVWTMFSRKIRWTQRWEQFCSKLETQLNPKDKKSKIFLDSGI